MTGRARRIKLEGDGEHEPVPIAVVTATIMYPGDSATGIPVEIKLCALRSFSDPWALYRGVEQRGHCTSEG